MTAHPTPSAPAYQVFVDDNFDFMDEDARHFVGSYTSYEQALAAAKSIVESSVRSMEDDTAAEILDSYQSFGDDPFIRPVGGAPKPAKPFSAWKYAEGIARKVAKERKKAKGSQ